jgi:hypothetical protein
MAAPIVANVLKTGAILWVAPVGEAKPSETTVAFGSLWGGNWARVGYTSAPLTLAYESTEEDIEVEEELTALKRWRVGENLTIETQLAELTAAYLQLAAGNQTAVSTVAAGAAQKAYESSGLGGVAELTEKAWGFEGLYITPGGTDEPVRVFVHKATAMLNGALTFTRKSGDKVSIPLQLKALVDTTQSAGYKLCSFQRVLSEVT